MKANAPEKIYIDVSLKKVAKEKAIELLDGLKFRNLEVTINDCYKTTIEEF